MTKISGYIEKEKIIDLFKRYQPYLATKVIQFGQELEDLPTVNLHGLWISVSERLPESGDIVLVTLNDSHVAEASYFNQHWVYYAGEAFESNYPVAWMPLPEPYKVESEDKDADSN